jgi:hypothetical protein
LPTYNTNEIKVPHPTLQARQGGDMTFVPTTRAIASPGKVRGYCGVKAVTSRRDLLMTPFINASGQFQPPSNSGLFDRYENNKQHREKHDRLIEKAHRYPPQFKMAR